MNLLDYIIYDPLPSYYKEAFHHNKELGWKSTPLTPDSYTIKPCHCPFKHIKEITIPKINKIKDVMDKCKIPYSENELIKIITK